MLLRCFHTEQRLSAAHEANHDLLLLQQNRYLRVPLRTAASGCSRNPSSLCPWQLSWAAKCIY